jgi:hypothetical protein
MKRRSFLTITSAAPIGLGVPASAQEVDKPETKEANTRGQWQEHEKTIYSGTFESSEGLLRLEVALIDENDEVTQEAIQTSNGEATRYTFKGKPLPRWLPPTVGIIKSFRFVWEGREIPVAERFWNDFGGCRLTRCTVDRNTIPPGLLPAFDRYQNNPDVPELILSADGGTALIEWRIIDTDACCGHPATMRWMISKSGHVMRHRHTTPNRC